MKSKYLILTLLLMCFLKNGIGQSYLIDSLRHVLAIEQDDTNKVNTLNSLAYALYTTVPDSTVLLAQQASVLALNIGWVKGEAKS